MHVNVGTVQVLDIISLRCQIIPGTLQRIRWSYRSTSKKASTPPACSTLHLEYASQSFVSARMACTGVAGGPGQSARPAKSGVSAGVPAALRADARAQRAAPHAAHRHARHLLPPTRHCSLPLHSTLDLYVAVTVWHSHTQCSCSY